MRGEKSKQETLDKGGPRALVKLENCNCLIAMFALRNSLLLLLSSLAILLQVLTAISNQIGQGRGCYTV